MTLSANSLSIGYASRVLLSGLQLKLESGSFVALLGRNGSGKSTLLKTLTRELKPISGNVEIDGVAVERFSRRKFAEILSVVTTDRSMAGGLRAREIVEMGRHPHTNLFARFNNRDREATVRALREVGVEHKADSFFAELSDGEKQKVMIARALAQETPFILLDEPFSFLDPCARIEIMLLLRRLARDKARAVLFSSHDVAQALRIADYIWLITADSQLLQGTPSRLVEQGAMERLFKSREVEFSAAEHDFVPAGYAACGPEV